MSCFSFFREKFMPERKSSSSPELGHPREVVGSTSAVASSKKLVNASGSIPISTRSLPEIFQEKEHNLRVFSYSELKEATNRFDRMLKLGEGGFERVYKGLIKPGDGPSLRPSRS